MANPLVPELPRPTADEPNIIYLGSPNRFVRWERTDGQESDVVRTARVSYAGTGTKTAEEDGRLVRYLLRNKHTSPFEHISQSFHISAELFTRSQLVRTRTANWNEQSGRYSEMAEAFYLPAALRNPSNANKQMSATGAFNGATCPECKGAKVVQVDDGFPSLSGQFDKTDVVCPECVGHGYYNEDALLREIDFHNRQAYRLYKKLLAASVSKELARMVLPQTLITAWYFRLDANNFMKTALLRLDYHAQPEVREIMAAMMFFFKRDFPAIYDAWLEYYWQARTLSGTAVRIIRDMLRTDWLSSEVQAKLAANFRGDELAYLTDTFVW